jgi:hypothetical protein
MDVLLAEALDRFPIHGPSRRNGHMSRVIASLIGRAYRSDPAGEVVYRWWEWWYEQDLVTTPPKNALKIIRANIDRTLRNPAFGRAVGVDHLARCREFMPSEEEMEGLGRLKISGRSLEGLPLLCNTVTPREGLCRKPQELAFVAALLAYFGYKLRVTRERPLKATRDQVVRLMQATHGLEIKNSQFERLLRKFISRLGRPATRFGLALQVNKGTPGNPSEYESTGILQLIEAAELPGPREGRNLSSSRPSCGADGNSIFRWKEFDAGPHP